MSSAASSPRSLRSDLRAMMGDGFAFSLMVGAGESYVAAFALALGFGDVAAALVATAPMLAGAVLQLVTPTAVAWLGSHKRWVVLCAGLQAATFLPLAAGALSGDLSPAMLFVAVSLYWGCGMATSPAWNTWAGTIVPPSMRASYFARRGAWSQAALLLGLGLGGEVLRRSGGSDVALEGYAGIFLFAFAARLVSVGYLARQSEPRPVPIGETRIAPSALREHTRSGGHGRLLAYLLAFQLSVWMAAPFFTPYMLGPLELDYREFALLTGTAFLARILALPFLGRLARARGTLRVLWLGSMGIVPLPLLWLVSDAFPWLLALQLGSGFAWGAFELSALLSFFEHIPERARTSILSAYNLANAAAIAGGSALGVLIFEYADLDAAVYPLLFCVSSGARLLSLGLLRGVADVHPASATPPPLRTLGLRPSAGALQRPILAGLDAGLNEQGPDPV